jgi:magnesium transporter
MSFQAIKDLLNKQKIVEGMLRNQPMPRHDLVETLVHKQHLAELEQLLARMPAAEIGKALENLSLEDAKLLWSHVPEAQEDDILWEVSDALRESLVGAREPHNGKGQMHAFELFNGRLRQIAITCRQDLEAIKPIWIDLLESTKSERAYIGKHYGLEIPDPDDLTDLESSARFYVDDNDDVHLHSDFLLDREGESRSVTVAFIVHQDILFTVRNQELPVFRLQRLRARNQPGYVSDCKDLLLDLYAADVEYSADSLEDVYATLGKVGRKVLNEVISDDEAAAILADIAEEEELNGRIRRNILDTQRAVSFLMRGKFLSGEQPDDARQIVRDIESLNSHTAFLFDKINFLMDATVGFININQNKVLKQLTILSVVFMPLNIIAGIGGMSEFSMMTHDIPWPIAYSVFSVGMVIVAWITFLILRLFEKRRLKGKLVAVQSLEAAS